MNLGDVVLATGAVSLLRNEYPDAKISMLVKSHAEEVLANCPLLDDLIVFRYKSKSPSLAAMYNTIKEVRSRKFDMCVLLDSKQRSALIAFFAGIPTRIGPIFPSDKKTLNPLLYTKIIDLRRSQELIEGFHQTTWFQGIINGFTGKAYHSYPVISAITSGNLEVARSLLASLPPAEKKIALCVKGTVPIKNWPKTNFRRLIERLAREIDAAFYVVGAPGDCAYADEIIAAMNIPVANFCGKTSIMDFVALMMKTDVFITVDTGGMHVAATTDVPIVSIFGPTPYTRFRPLGNRSIILHGNIACNPCDPTNCHDVKCLSSITVEQVFEAAIKQLGIFDKAFRSLYKKHRE